MLLGMLLRPSVPPQAPSVGERRLARPAYAGAQSWRFACARLLRQGARRLTTVLAPSYWQAGYSASAVGYLWSLGVVAEVIIFALSKSYSAGLAPATLLGVAFRRA